MKKILSLFLAITMMASLVTTATAKHHGNAPRNNHNNHNNYYSCNKCGQCEECYTPVTERQPIISPELSEIMANTKGDDLIPVWIFRKNPVGFVIGADWLTVNRPLMKKYNADFAAKHLTQTENDDLFFISEITGTVIMKATPTEIEKFAKLGEVSGISWYDESLVPVNDDMVVTDGTNPVTEPLPAAKHHGNAPHNNQNNHNNHNSNCSCGCIGEFKTGFVCGKDSVTIADALEILKRICGMNSVIDDCNNSLNASLITPNSQQNGTPAIEDALEVLKHLSNMDSLID